MKVEFLVLLAMMCLVPAVRAELYVWGGAGSEATTVAWDDAADNGDGVNEDADHWGNPVAPNPFNEDSVIIASGGVSRGTLRITGVSVVEVLTGGYLWSGGADVGRNSGGAEGNGGRLVIDGGYLNCQWLGVYSNDSVAEIIAGRVNLRGGGDPLPARGGYINFIGNSGVMTAPNKTADPVFLENNILAGDLRIEGVVLSAVDEVVNDKYFVLSDGGTTVTLMSPKALDPSPRISASDVETDYVLTWTPGRDPNNPAEANPAIAKHYVWLSSGDPDDPNLTLVATIDAGEAAEYAPAGGFNRDSVYYWRIDEGVGDYPVGDPNNFIGDVWWFSTEPSTPTIDEATPMGTLADDGGEATLAVAASNPLTGDSTGLNYEWFKVALPDAAVGENSPTLTITGAGLDDEGAYYCIVSVAASGASSISRQATLTIKRIIGHWPMDMSLDDAVNGNNGSAASVEYVPGVVQDAVMFGAGSAAVEIPTAAHANLAWSLSWWEKSNPDAGGGEWEAMIGSGATGGFEVLEANRYRTDKYAVGVAGSYVYSDAGTSYDRGAWHHQAVTYDAASSTLTLYANGEPAGSASASLFAGFDVSLFVGNVRDGSQPYLGAIDDLRFYNYALTPREVASLYTDVRPEAVLCLGNPNRDLDGDCDVDIDDLAMFLASWLECGKIPNCDN